MSGLSETLKSDLPRIMHSGVCPLQDLGDPYVRALFVILSPSLSPTLNREG